MSYRTVLVQLPLVCEGKGDRLSTPVEVYTACSDIATLAQEVFHVLTCDAKNRLIKRHMVTMGLLDASLVHAREVFRPAILDGAAAVILVHNHPSGDPSPSTQDVTITRALLETGKVLDILVLDHVVIGRAGHGRPAYVSLRESGLCAFS